MIPHSQLSPLPSELPFRIVSKTIGQGAYACIKKASPLHSPKPVFAVKFIHKDFVIRHGRLTKKQLDLELSLHSFLGQHKNIVRFFQSGEDLTWRWIAMELAEGGDLFDKIESDVGVEEDIAHVYFTQLISAVTYMHSKGVGHRDIKPENILLSAEGDLKIADFGLATLFEYKGAKKLCKTSCGSPPYTAPEVVTCDSRVAKQLDQGYYGNYVDIWSCGVVLFVLLVGNTPWDEPLNRSYEFDQYVKTNGRPDDELWHNLPVETLSLLRGMMRVTPEDRFSLNEIRRHPWFTRHNKYLTSGGKLQNPVALATDMFESMKIDFSQDPMASQPKASQPFDDPMETDNQNSGMRQASTQPETPVNDIMFDWERPSRLRASQSGMISDTPLNESNLDDRLAEEPSFSQFSSTPQVPLSKTQFARQFRDIVPAHSLTRFFSLWSSDRLHSVISEALHRLGIPTSYSPGMLYKSDGSVWIKIRTTDTRNCPISGDIVMDTMTDMDGRLLEINFIKGKGDPLEWRRLFKKIVVLCKDAVYKPDYQDDMLSQ
ncbi:Chk1 protein kinase [Lecanora helva]